MSNAGSVTETIVVGQSEAGLVRPCYSPRQVVTADDLNDGQAYLREMLRQHNRLTHGCGVVCGLEVLPAPPDPQSGLPQVKVTAGYALSPQGDEILVPSPQTVLVDCAPIEGDECLDTTRDVPQVRPVYLGLRYAEEPACPIPIYPERCAPLPTCQHKRHEARFEFECLNTLPDLPPRPDCHFLVNEIVRCQPLGTLGYWTPLAACPPDDAPPYVILAALCLSAKVQRASVDYSVRQRLFATQILGEMLRCIARVAPTDAESGVRFEVYVDRASEWRWRLVAERGEILADSGEGFATKAECVADMDRLRRGAAAAEVEDLTLRPPADRPVIQVRGIGRKYTERLETLEIRTVGELAGAPAPSVAATLRVSEARAGRFIEAANRLLAG